MASSDNVDKVEIQFVIVVESFQEIDKVVSAQAKKFFGDRAFYYTTGPGAPYKRANQQVVEWNFFVQVYTTSLDED